MLYMLRDYAPVTNILAMILLPIALFPAQTDEVATISLAHGSHLYWLRGIFLAAFVANKINACVVYGHIGLSRVWNFQSNEIWAAPCKCTLFQ